MAKNDDVLARALRNQLAQCDTWQGGDLAKMHELALAYYNSAKRGDEVAGSSAVVSSDVADMLEAVTAGIMPAFSTQRVIEFEAYNPEDEQQAIQESDAVNYLIMSENRGYIMLQSAIRNALLLRNGFTKTWIKEEVDTSKKTFSGIEPDMVTFLAESSEPGFTRELVSLSENDDGTVNCTFRDTKITRRLMVTSTDPLRMYLQPGYTGDDIQEIPFIAEQVYYSRSQLIEAGYNKTAVNALPAAQMLPTNTGESERDGGMVAAIDAYQKAQDLIECFECYWRLDDDGDGITELRKLVISDKTILENVEVDFVPYATGSPIIAPNRVIGLGLFDKLKMVQDVKTATLRQYLDCFQNGNLGRVGYVRGMVNTDHLLNPRPSGAVELMDPNAIVPLPSIDIGPSAQALLDYMDKVRSARGGASLDLQSAEAQVMGETAQGIERQYSVREQLAALMARTLAETLIAGTYINCHRALRAWRPGDLTYKTRQGFETTNPGQWPPRYKVNVAGGLSAGEQRAKQQALAGVIQQQTQMLSSGLAGVVASLPGLYKSVVDWARAGGIDNPEAYFVNPETPEAQQAQQAQAQAQQQQQQAQQAILQAQLQIEQGKNENQRLKIEYDNRFNYYNAQLNAEIKEAEIVGDASTKLALEKLRKAMDSDAYRKGE